MALVRRVTTTPNQFFGAVKANISDAYSSPKVTPSLKSAGGTGAYSFSQATYQNTSNPFGFTEGQVAAGFQSANTVGQQYAGLREAPAQYKATTKAQAQADVDAYGMLASFFGPHIRQALETPIQTRDPFTGAATGDAGSLSYSVGVDWALGEKQSTFGTPQYFRKLYYDTLPNDPQYSAMGMNLVAGPQTRATLDEQRYQEQAYQTAFQSGSHGLSTSMKTPHDAAYQAASGSYQTSYAGSVSITPADSNKAFYGTTGYQSLRENEQYLQTGTGDFQGPHISVSSGTLGYPSMGQRMWF